MAANTASSIGAEDQEEPWRSKIPLQEEKGLDEFSFMFDKFEGMVISHITVKLPGDVQSKEIALRPSVERVRQALLGPRSNLEAAFQQGVQSSASTTTETKSDKKRTVGTVNASSALSKDLNPKQRRLDDRPGNSKSRRPFDVVLEQKTQQNRCQHRRSSYTESGDDKKPHDNQNNHHELKHHQSDADCAHADDRARTDALADKFLDELALEIQNRWTSEGRQGSLGYGRIRWQIPDFEYYGGKW